MWKDKRSRKLALIAHCILNENSRAYGLVENSNMSMQLVNFLMQNRIGIIQLPCPELTFAGVLRQPKTKNQYDTVDFRRHCRKIVQDILDQIVEYENSDIRLKIVIGVQRSPSCGVHKNSGILMEELKSYLDKKQIHVSFYETNFRFSKYDILQLRKLIK
jgi:predicted secreted protein